MSEIPGPAWMAVGAFIGAVSLFLGFIRPVVNSSFFKMMMIVGIGMVIFGFIKMKFKAKTKEDVLDEARRRSMQRGQSEYDIDIDDYRNDPRLRQQAMYQQAQQKGYAQQHPQAQGGANAHASHPNAQAHLGVQHQKHPYVVHQQRAQNVHHPMHHSQKESTVHVLRQAHSHNPLQGGFCGQCGTPLLKSHKFCPMCGART
jgi:Sec-independent protein translocase protein TatA